MYDQEQKQYMEMLKQIITQTRKNEIQTTDEIINELVGELTKTNIQFNSKFTIAPQMKTE